MNLSVVINTYNRADSLKLTLESLKMQSSEAFEVIVVNGPSTDNTIEVVKQYGENIKLISCPERNLSISRNLGIEAASGDIVAFIDDDGIADPNWVKDLLSHYDNDLIGGVGGLVYDHTGMKLQYEYSACDRLGDTDFSVKPPFREYNQPYANKFLYLQGTNCSFRKSCLEAIGGFDEEFEYYLDEVDVCMRIIDKGFIIKPVRNAIVHHKYMKSFLRNENRVVLHPYSTVKNKYYFAYQNNKVNKIKDIDSRLKKWVKEVINGGKCNFLEGKINQNELDIYLKEVENAVIDGKEHSIFDKKIRTLHTASHNEFKPFETKKCKEKRLKICYLSKEYPPVNFGGIGRYTYDLATTFASKGHEVHVITEGYNQDTVDLEEGVWVHRIVNRLYNGVEKLELGWNFSLMMRNFQEIQKINKTGNIDIINGPIWLCETGFCNDLLNIPVCVTLMTTQKIIFGLMNQDSKSGASILRLEEKTLNQHFLVHAISESIKNSCNDNFNERALIETSPLGCRDLAKKLENNIKKETNELINILIVGRLEERKGTDIILKAVDVILPKFSNVRFIFAGKDTDNTKIGKSYKKLFQEKHKKNPYILNKVIFTGEVTEKNLIKLYESAHICCVPSRYESFGIVVLEAMSFSKPIIASRIGGMKDIIKDGITGLLFEVENVEDLIKCIEKLIVDTSLRNKIALSARNEYEQKYSLEKIYFTTYKMYNRFINYYNKYNSGLCYGKEKIAELISYSEGIEMKRAVCITKELLKGQKYTADGAQIVKHNIILKRIFNIIKHTSPKAAYIIKDKLYGVYLELLNVTLGKKVKIITRFIYHSCCKIYFIGPLIRYVGTIFLLPVKINRLEDKINITSNLIDEINKKIETHNED